MKSEHHEQCRFFNYVNFLSSLHQDEKELIYAVPSGGYRKPTEAIRLKAEGVRTGIPDVSVDLPRGGFHGMRIEMKRGKGGSLSPDQVRKHELLRKQGYYVVTCNSAEIAITELEKYLGTN